jgi:hypothetical protein
MRGDELSIQLDSAVDAGMPDGKTPDKNRHCENLGFDLLSALALML